MADKSQLSEYLQRNHQQPHKLAQLKAVFPDVADRTLRRWLSALVEQGLLLREGVNKGTVYQWANSPPSATDYQTTQSGLYKITEPQQTSATTNNNESQSLIFSEVSREVLARATAPLYSRVPVTYNSDWLDAYIPNQTFYLSIQQRELLQQLGKRQALPTAHRQVHTYIRKILNRLIVDLSFNSARLEGNTYSLADTEKLLLRGISTDGKLDEERIMILNHKEAIRYLVQNIGSTPINEQTIRTLHYLLADSLVEPGMAGNIREQAIGVSGTTYAPLEGEERLSMLLNKVLQKAAAINDCFEQSFFLLGHIAYLQAFIDVNKRTARLASIIPLISQDYVPLSFVDVPKDDYLTATICFYEFNRHEPLAELYIWSYIKSCQRYDVFTQVVSFDEIAALYRAQRRAMIADIVRNKISLINAKAFITQHIPGDINPQHHSKFSQDVLDELQHLDLPRTAGMGLTQAEFLDWQKCSASK